MYLFGSILYQLIQMTMSLIFIAVPLSSFNTRSSQCNCSTSSAKTSLTKSSFRGRKCTSFQCEKYPFSYLLAPFLGRSCKNETRAAAESSSKNERRNPWILQSAPSCCVFSGGFKEILKSDTRPEERICCKTIDYSARVMSGSKSLANRNARQTR